mmetsp:Transcript_48830/g.116253  ORF Transcript_48830/g.116253 Transcript_48830/m.116253 type:complete len:242 (-) Transcript_48830:82-807(-)
MNRSTDHQLTILQESSAVKKMLKTSSTQKMNARQDVLILISPRGQFSASMSEQSSLQQFIHGAVSTPGRVSTAYPSKCSTAEDTALTRIAISTMRSEYISGVVLSIAVGPASSLALVSSSSRSFEMLNSLIAALRSARRRLLAWVMTCVAAFPTCTFSPSRYTLGCPYLRTSWPFLAKRVHSPYSGPNLTSRFLEAIIRMRWCGTMVPHSSATSGYTNTRRSHRASGISGSVESLWFPRRS